jgi:hypothetical protein
VLSYLNPFSYIVKETPFEDEDPKSPLGGKSVVSVFGVPLFTTESVDDTLTFDARNGVSKAFSLRSLIRSIRSRQKSLNPLPVNL